LLIGAVQTTGGFIGGAGWAEVNGWIRSMVLYDLLSFDKGFTWDKSKKIPSHKTIPAKKSIELEPVVKKEGLKGAHIYYDCASLYPERLTLAF